MDIHRLSCTLAVLLLALASPALAGPVRCQTYPEPTMCSGLQTVQGALSAHIPRQQAEAWAHNRRQ
jgi:hypothetical protein